MSRVERSLERRDLQHRIDRINRQEVAWQATKANVWGKVGPFIMEPGVQATIGGLVLILGLVFGTSPE